MEDNCTVVRFSRETSLARIENLKQSPGSIDRLVDDGNSFGLFYIICVLLSIITYVVDLVLAITLLYYYYVNEYGLYFALTLSFILLPSICMTTISLRWYIIDHDDPSLIRISLTRWVIRMIFLLLQLSPLLRYIDTLIYGIKSKIAATTGNDSQQVILYRRCLDEDTNSALLRLFHCFLHSAPQAIIQLVIMLIHMIHPEKPPLNTDLVVIQSWTVLAGVMSIAWSLTSYHRSVRYARDDKDKIKCAGMLVAFCWQLMSALSRVLALSLLAAVFPAWTGCVCALHWVVMSLWLALGQQQQQPVSAIARGRCCEEMILSVALGLAYVISFIAPRDGPTRYVYLAYYLVCFMENTGALVVWCVANNSSENPFLYYGAAGGQVLAFSMAIAFMLIYYKYCHPSMQNRMKMPRDDSDLECDKPCYSKSSYNVRTGS